MKRLEGQNIESIRYFRRVNKLSYKIKKLIKKIYDKNNPSK